MKDNYDFWEDHDREQNRRLRDLPTCCCCGEAIQDESAYCIEGDWYHESCLEENFKKYVDDYVV